MRPAAHQAFAARAIERLRRDPCIVGVAASGSWVRGAMDEFSDLDLVIAVDPPALPAVLEDRLQLAGEVGPLLAAFTGEHVGKPQLVICLYGPPVLHVDLDFVTLAEAAVSIDRSAVLWERDGSLTRVLEGTPPAVAPGSGWQWLEDRFWVWVHYLAGKLGRGELFEVIGGLAFVRDRVLGPVLLTHHGRPPYGVRRAETLPAEDVVALRETLADHDPRSCLHAVRATAALYQRLRELRAPASLVRRTDAERAALAYLDTIASRLPAD